MNSHVHILDIYLTIDFNGKKYGIVIDNTETLDIYKEHVSFSNPIKKDMEVDISKEFNNFIKKIEEKCLRKLKEAINEKQN